MTHKLISSKDFVGTWKLTAYVEKLDDGTVIYPLGKNAIGRLVYDDNGHFAAQLMKQDRPAFASGNIYGGTTNETEAAYNGYLAYFGRYEIDANKLHMMHHVDACMFPNWIGITQVREYEFQGDKEMSLTTPPLVVAGKKGVSVLAWIREES
jgi:hypothetical protein